MLAIFKPNYDAAGVILVAAGHSSKTMNWSRSSSMLLQGTDRPNSRCFDRSLIENLWVNLHPELIVFCDGKI
jgi:hypothetical protein